MTDTNKPIAKPRQAIEYMINDAVERGDGALNDSYQAWYSKQFNVLQNKARQTGGDASDVAVNAQIKEKTAEWADGVRATFNASQDTANQNNQLVLNPEGIVANLMNGGGIMSILGGIISQLKPVKDFMATITTWLGSKIGHMFNKDTSSLSFAEAAEQVKTGNNNNAAFNQMNQAGYVADLNKFMQALNNSPVRDEPSIPAPAAATVAKPSIALDESIAQQPVGTINSEALKQIEALKQDGKLVLNEGKPFATQEALDVLNKMPSQLLPGRVGNSWAAKE